MLKVHVSFHKDGDHLVITKIPWWYHIYDRIANQFCPCCGITGWFSGKSEHIEEFFYRFMNFLLKFLWKHEKELYAAPVESACLVYQKIFEKEVACFADDCENCWHLQDDAFNSGGE